ncbi:MAG: hypothetical protein V4658_15255 [Bacteroidota bacterium]
MICIFSAAPVLHAQTHYFGIDGLMISRDSSAPELFMTGEFHGYSSNTSVEEAYIKYLTLNHHVRTILREEGYGLTYLLRKYLSTGDTVFLNLFTSDLPFSFEETKKYIVTLKQINDQLPTGEKLNLVAIDVTENDWQPYVKNFFRLILDREVYNPSLKQEIDSFIESNNFPLNISGIKRLLTGYQNNSDYSLEFDRIVNSYVNWQFIKKRLYRQREYYLYKNILQAQLLFKGNVYINFGNHHTLVTPKHTAYYLKKDTSFKYQVSVANPFYYNCINRLANRKPHYSKNKGYFHKRYFEQTIKCANLSRGIYTTKVKGETYIIHVNQPGMTAIK